MNIRSLFSACIRYSAKSCQQMVHGVFTHEHLTIAVLCLLRYSASLVSRWFMEFALMNICQIAVLQVCAPREPCQQMVHGVFALMNI
jgi:hypothetical protein